MSDYGSSGPGLALFSGVFGLIQIGLIIVFAIAWWKIFEKAGKPGWAGLIPFYNLWVMCEILWFKKGWMYFIGFLIPFVNIVVMILYILRLAKAFGKGIGFALGLLFLGPIFILILAFGDSEYHPEALQ